MYILIVNFSVIIEFSVIVEFIVRNCKIHCIIIVIRQQRTGMTSQWGITPRFGAGQTPMVGSMTPMHGVGSGRTPMYGSQTPQHGDGQLIY